MKALTWFGRLLSKEPVLLGAAILAWFQAANLTESQMLAVGATVALLQRWLSTPTSTAQAQTATAVEAKETTISAYLQGAQDAAPPPAKVSAAKVQKAAKKR